MLLAGLDERWLYHPIGGGPAATEVAPSSNTRLRVPLKSTEGISEALSSCSLKLHPNSALDVVSKENRLLSAVPPQLRLPLPPPPPRLRRLRDDDAFPGVAARWSAAAEAAFKSCEVACPGSNFSSGSYKGSLCRHTASPKRGNGHEDWSSGGGGAWLKLRLWVACAKGANDSECIEGRAMGTGTVVVKGGRKKGGEIKKKVESHTVVRARDSIGVRCFHTPKTSSESLS